MQEVMFMVYEGEVVRASKECYTCTCMNDTKGEVLRDQYNTLLDLMQY